MKLKFSEETSLHTGLTLTGNIVTTGRRNGVLFHVPNPHLPWDKLLFPSKLSCFSLKMFALKSGTHRQLTLMRRLTTERHRHEPPVLSNLVTSSRRCWRGLPGASAFVESPLVHSGIVVDIRLLCSFRTFVWICLLPLLAFLVLSDTFSSSNLAFLNFSSPSPVSCDLAHFSRKALWMSDYKDIKNQRHLFLSIRNGVIM